MDQFIPWRMRLVKAQEFEILKKRSMTVEEYDTEFNRLSNYTSYMLLDEREKIRGK